MNDRKINTILNKQITRLIQEINKNKLIFNREVVIQARLYNYVCEELNEWKPRYNIKFNNFHESKLVNLMEDPVEQKISRIQLEYFGGQGKAIDMVILDENDLENMEKFSFEKAKSTQHLKLSHAIEIKALQGWEGNKRNLLLNDVGKLKDLKRENRAEYLHFICIIRWPTRNPKKHKELHEILEDVKSECDKKPNVEFHTNSRENYFYPYENSTLFCKD